jgi:hypothetical protein
MIISEIAKKITSDLLNENLAKKFGQRIKLENFTLEQLQDARNKIRTTLSQVETNESFNAVSNENYQKSKMYLDVLNQAIKEREDISEGEMPAGLKKHMEKKGKGKAPAKGKSKSGKMPMDAGKDGKKGTKDDKPAFLKKESIDEGKTIIANYFNTLLEGAEDSAELVMAAKDMVDRVTGWMEDTAEMQTESMLELADAIRDEMGSEASEAFVNTVKPALEAMYTTMESTRISLTSGVGQLTGEGEPMDTMGGDDLGMDADMEPTTDMDMAGGDDADMDMDMDSGDDDFGADAAATGGEEEAGRAKRESVERSRRLGQILSKKK